MTNTRSETDSFGPIDVPADCYWGAQTQRSIDNFPFGPREAMPVEIVHALGFVKQAAARVNAKSGELGVEPAVPRNDPRRRLLDEAQSVDDLGRHRLARAEREILDRTLGLRAPISVGGNVDRAEAVAFAARAAVAVHC